MKSLLSLVFALFSLCNCTPIKDVGPRGDRPTKIPIQAVNELWEIIDSPEFDHVAYAQWLAKWNLTNPETDNSDETPSMSDSAVQALKLRTVSKLVTQAASRVSSALEHLAAKLLTKFEKQMFVRFFVHFLHELREETGIKGGSDNPGYYIPGHLLRKILDQDQVDNDVPLVNVCKAKVESRMICALDRLFYAALGLESFTKISHPTEQDKEKLREVSSRLNNYEQHMLNRLFLHFMDEVEEENGIPHQFSRSEQELIDQDKDKDFN